MSKKLIGFVGALVLLAAACGDAEETSQVAAAPASTTALAVQTTTEAFEQATTSVAREATTTTAIEEVNLDDYVLGLPEGMPATFEGVTLGLIEGETFEPIPGGQAVNIAGQLEAEDGTVVDAEFRLLDLRKPGGTVVCNGESQDGPYTADTDELSTGWMTIIGWGSVQVRLEHTVTVFPERSGPPTCDEQIGIWIGTDGELEGRAGTFERARFGPYETVTLG